MKLNQEARDRLSEVGITPTEWSRKWFGKSDWGGDACGCPDDRCRGHHHLQIEPCMCLRSLAAEASKNQAKRQELRRD